MRKGKGLSKVEANVETLQLTRWLDEQSKISLWGATPC